MKMKIVGSIYQSNGAGIGLPIVDGRLVNDRPCPVIGLQKMASERKAMKKAEKISTMSDAYVAAEINSKMMGL